MRTCLAIAVALSLLSCVSKRSYRILGSIEDPQNKIAYVMAEILNAGLSDSVVVIPGVGSQANLDSLINGRCDFAIVDNYSEQNAAVAAIAPVYSQILHILYRGDFQPASFRELFTNRKVFAGNPGSGVWKLAHQLMVDYEIPFSSVSFVDELGLFDADVIMSFTDLLTHRELQDLQNYKFFSLDDVDNLGRGSLAEGICARHPEFSPYIIAKSVYGDFAACPILTVKVDAILVCRQDLDSDVIYSVIDLLNASRHKISSINPLLYNFSGDFDPGDLSFALHEGAARYLKRLEPGIIEKHADLISVLVTIVFAVGGSLYSFFNWRQNKKSLIGPRHDRITKMTRQKRINNHFKI
jgi:TRAP-type uncharacterized transport system substrate-binding protein